ncbi:cilia- and flagella-associated protein 54 [Microcaecilia unicolor]|uniref:Cilia- and flagella-associated protein 54-like n=1 Tax=Microcaecilia unicolor TaxID=1415580 RepID=A0A6P7YU74_9AMPH|nr:cilia- and flagella-associated protein 54-like [Microcaecilia unicolor]
MAQVCREPSQGGEIGIPLFLLQLKPGEGKSMKYKMTHPSESTKKHQLFKQIPAVGDNLLEINGLEANEKYTFAVAAYSANGKLIGDAVAYQVGNYTLAMKAFSVLWEHFVSAPPPPANVSVVSASNIMTASQKRLRAEAVSQASPVLLELFLLSIFSASDISVKEGSLFCDSVSANGIPYKWQLKRIAECERMLVAFELSSYLNDTNYALQVVVQCYGLLAPIIYHRIASVPVVQILIKCLAVLQEIPSSVWQKRSSGCTESVVHMIACTVCFLAKVLRSWKENNLAVLIIDIGKKLLLSERSSIIILTGKSRSSTNEVSPYAVQETGGDGQISSGKKGLKKKVASIVIEKVSEQLAALEAHLLKLTTPLPGQELTGQESPILLLPIVTCWPVQLALKEVMKFKGKVRFLEFFVRVLHRTVHEEKFPQVLEWSSSTQDYLKKRNDILLGKKVSGKEFGNITVTGEAYRRYTAALMEYQQRHEKGGMKMDKPKEKPAKMKGSSKKQEKKRSESSKFGVLDPEVFSLYHSGTVIMEKETKTWDENAVEPSRVESPLKIEPKKRIKRTGGSDAFSERSTRKSDMDTPRTQRTNETGYTRSPSAEEEKENPLNNLFDYFNKTYLHLRRAVVLAHRGSHWTLLQNVCRELWNITLEAQLISKHTDLPTTLHLLNRTICLPFYLASDMIMDMIIMLQYSNSIQIIDSEENFSIPSCTGGIADDEGGSNLTFEYPLDDVNVIHCRNIIGKQLRVSTVYKKRTDTDGEHDVYSDVWRAKALVSVPLNVMDTLKCFRESLEKSKYHSRALRHSRKLYALFLAHTQGHDTLERKPTSGKVGFRANIAKTQVPVPPDLLKEDFTSLTMVQSSAMLPSQLSVVISSYDKTIEVLHASKKQGLKAQALHELGNLHLYARHKRATFQCWCQALDEIFNMTDVLNTWQEPDSISEYSNLKSPDYSERFLYQAGIWGCLQAAVITAKIAQYILTSNVKLRTECCILSSFLFKALLRASLSHPRDDCDYALSGSLIDTELMFLQLFSCLNFIIMELYGAGQNLLILPLLTLYQYFVSTVCHEPLKSIEGRILKAKVLTDLRFFTEACYELFHLNQGQRIPKRLGEGFRYATNDMIIQKLDMSKSLLVNENLQLIQEILNEKPSLEFTSICEHQIMNKLILAKIHFIISLCATMSIIPEMLTKSSYTVIQGSIKGKKDSSAQAQKQQPEMTATIQLVGKQNLTVAKLKGILLTEAETVVTALLTGLEKCSDSMIPQWPATELEIAIEGRLLLLAVAQQKYQTTRSVAVAVSIIHLLQDADIFKIKHPNQKQVTPSAWKLARKTKELKSAQDMDTDDSHLPYNIELRDRLNIHLWLRCRHALITILVTKVHGIGAIQEWNVLDCSSLITEAIVEADAFGDTETQAKLMLQAVVLDLKEGRPKKGIRRFLKEIIHLLEKRHLISPEASLTLVQAQTLLADIMVTGLKDGKDHKYSEKDQLNLLIQANKLINKQLLSFGQDVEQHLEDSVHTSPLLPLRNIYLPDISILAKVKLRIGNALAHKASCTLETQDSSHWLPALRLLNNALTLCRMSSMNELDLEAEILFQKGKVERQIMVADHLETAQAAETFLDAIKTSQRNDQNFRLIRKAYLELALLYFHLASLGTNENTGVAPPKSRIIKETTNTINENEVTLSKSEICRLKAWIAIRAATQVNEAMAEYYRLLGESSVILSTLTPTSQQQIPTFASMDLLASYKDFVSDDYQLINNFDLQEPFVEEEEKPTDEDEAASRDDESKKISWFHLICYHNQLVKLAGMTSRTASPKSWNELDWRGDTLYTSVVNTGVIQRLAEIHLFLKNYLFMYSVCCTDVSPEELHPSTETSVAGEPKSSKTTLQNNKPEEMSKVNELANDNMVATNSSKKELCIQWYLPSLERPPKDELMIMLLYAYNTDCVEITNLKTCSITDMFCGYLWIPLARIISLHEKLSALKQQTELSGEPPKSAPSSRSTKKKRLSHGKAKPESEKTQSGPKPEELFKECCSEAKDLLSTVSYQKTITKVPFELSIQSLTTLQNIFDPSGGCVIMEESFFAWITSLLA